MNLNQEAGTADLRKSWQNEANEPRNPRSRSRRFQDASPEPKNAQISRDKGIQGHQTKPSAQKLEHEMTQHDKDKAKIEKTLLRAQIERDNVTSHLEKLQRASKKTGLVLKKIKDLEEDEARLNQEISKLKIELRQN